MKRNYSYFIIKPDGIRYIDSILDNLMQEFKSLKFYAVDNYEEIIKKLYYKIYEKKGKKFEKSFQSYLYGSNEIFGNKALLVLLADDELTYEELTKKVYEKKLEIREEYSNNNIGIVTNYGDDESNYIRFVNKAGELKKPRILKEEGNHRISDMNIIHSPDPEVLSTQKELRILIDSGVIKDENMLTIETVNKLYEYRTFNFLEDLKKPGYEGNIQPNLSNFLKSEIEK